MATIEPHGFVDSKELSIQSGGELAANDRADCTVRAIMCAFDWSYKKAYDWTETHMGRKPNEGPSNADEKISELAKEGYIFDGRFFRDLSCFGYIDRQPTIGDCINVLVDGSFIISIRGHYLCVKDGIEYNNYPSIGSNLDTEVISLFEVVSAKTLECKVPKETPEQCKTCSKFLLYGSEVVAGSGGWVCWETFGDGLLPPTNPNNNCKDFEIGEH